MEVAKIAIGVAGGFGIIIVGLVGGWFLYANWLNSL